MKCSFCTSVFVQIKQTRYNVFICELKVLRVFFQRILLCLDRAMPSCFSDSSFYAKLSIRARVNKRKIALDFPKMFSLSLHLLYMFLPKWKIIYTILFLVPYPKITVWRWVKLLKAWQVRFVLMRSWTMECKVRI